MANVYTDIMNAFVNQFLTLPGLDTTQIAYENREFKPNVATMWFEPKMIPVPSIQAELGDTGMNMQKGIFQVTVNALANDGWGNGLQVADSVVNLFKRGTVLSNGSVSDIKIRRAWRGAALSDQGWWKVAVSVDWYVLTANS